MPDFAATLDALRKPLALEARRGCQDTAIAGRSLEVYVADWVRRYQPSDGPAFSLFARLRASFVGYRKAPPPQRRDMVAAALALLDEIARLAGSPEPTRSSKPSATRRARATGGDRESLDAAALDLPLSSRGRRPLWAERAERLGLRTNRDLLWHLPRDHTPIVPLARAQDGQRAAFLVTAGRREVTPRRRGGQFLTLCSLEVSDDTGSAIVTSFLRRPRGGARAQAILRSPIALNFTAGARLLIEGTVGRAGCVIDIQFLDATPLERLDDGRPLRPGHLVPIYPLTEGLYQSQLRPLTRQLGRLASILPEPLPPELRRQHGLPPLGLALRDFHWPPSAAARERARRRLAFDEFFTIQLALAHRKRENAAPGCGRRLVGADRVLARLEAALPFRLTAAQRRVMGEVAADFASGNSTNRLIQGDVGSGKTVVAVFALLLAVENGGQAALMTPTEILAEQHYLVLRPLLEAVGVPVSLLTGSVRGKDRERVLAGLADGRLPVIVGTHALIQEGVSFADLGLVIVDEQHRFGVVQRAALRAKSGATSTARPETLVMTATPIPRTLALTLYGDLDISILDESPPGRQKIETRWARRGQPAAVWDFVRGQVAQGRQAYIVCPLIEESAFAGDDSAVVAKATMAKSAVPLRRTKASESLQAEAATRLAAELGSVFPGFRIGLLHGRLKLVDKEKVMNALRARELDLLVTTTVIEVGVDIPNATVMVILNAERFGLAQLHQLRGRVGRGAEQSHCFLLSDVEPIPGKNIGDGADVQDPARRRLRTLCQTADGFAVAEEDLRLRGPGEFYGARQHGLPDFRAARAVEDLPLLLEARQAAFALLEADPGLDAAEHALLRERVAALRAQLERLDG